MALRARIDSLEGMDDGVSSLYVKNGEGYILDVEGVDGFALEDVSGLKSGLQKERRARETAEKSLKPYLLEDGEYLDPTAAQEAFVQVKEFSKLDPDKEADKRAAEKIELTRKAMQADFQAKEQAWTAREGSLLGAATSAMTETAIDVALSDPEVGGIPKILKPLIRPHLRVSEEDGRFSLWVNDPDHPDQPRLNGSGDPMSPKELALELKKDPDLAGGFRATKPKGSGPTPTHHQASTPGKKSEGLSGVSRIANALREQGLD